MAAQDLLLTRSFCALLSILIALSTSSAAAADDVATYIVHMDSSAMPSAFSARRSWYSATLAATSEDDVSDAEEKIVYVYDNVIHGFSARLSPAQLDRVKKSPGFLSCYRDDNVKKDTTHTSDFLGLSAGGGLWPAADFGEDVIIGVVDTGVWPESASYRDDGLPAVPSRWRGACEAGTAFSASACNRKLIGARSFSKGLRASDPNLTIGIESPRDTDGHGTHTSSTAAGSYVSGAAYFGYAPGTARGMAPRARLAIYKALWEEGAVASDIIAAIDRAISDGVDVISLSLGIDGVPLYQDPIAIATFAAMEMGIFVSTSTGNEGPFFGLLHNGTPWVLTVGASTVDREFTASIDLGDGGVILGQSLYAGRPASTEEMPLAFLGTCDNTTLMKNTRHKIVVCEAIDLGIAVQNVRYAKVDAALFISNDQFTELFIQFAFPGAVISPQASPAILNYIRAQREPKATLRFRQTKIGTTPAPVVATYTSRGPSASCPSVLKPDIIAPGSLILASWAQNTSVARARSHKLYSAFNIISGSSMSCPHAAGVAALLKAAHPDWSPAAIRSALMTTANHLDNTGSPIKDMGSKNNKPASPVAMGAGHINPNKALEPGLIYDANPSDYVNLICAMNFTDAQIRTITRSTATSTDCSNSNLDLNYPSFIAYFDANSTSTGAAREFRRTVTNVGDPAAIYRAEITQIRGFTIRVVPELLVFREKNERQSFAVTVKEDVTATRVAAVAHGSLSWVGDTGKCVVRSPIVATALNQNSSL